MQGQDQPPEGDGPDGPWGASHRRPRGHFLRRLAVLFLIALLLLLGLEAAAPPAAWRPVEDAAFVRYLLFGAIVIFALAASRRSLKAIGGQLAVWLGLLGWWLQGLMEFSLYVPALAWCAFAMMGWLLARSGKPFDKPPAGA